MSPKKNQRKQPGSLSIFGIGPKGLSQLTLEAVEAMKFCDEIYGSTMFQEPLSAFCRTLKIPFKPLNWGQHFNAKHDETNPGDSSYDCIFDEIKGQLKAGICVGLFVDGHPSLFCFAGNLSRQCGKEGYSCRTYAAISALDQILVALDSFGGPRLASGAAIYNVLSPDIAAAPENIHLSSDSGIFLYNVGQLFKSSPRQFKILFRHLRKTCGDARQVYLIECTPTNDNVRVCALRELVGELRLIGVNLTLFVPQLP